MGRRLLSKESIGFMPGMMNAVLIRHDIAIPDIQSFSCMALNFFSSLLSLILLRQVFASDLWVAWRDWRTCMMILRLY